MGVWPSCRGTVARGLRLVTSLVCLALPGAAVATGTPLKVCLLAHNAPYAMRVGASGFDAETAAAVAAHLERPFAPVWTDNDPQIQEIDDSDFPLPKLARGDCDALFSMPGPAADTLAGRADLALGKPYYGAAFELLACGQDVPPQFRALRDRKVAIQSQTVAHFALLMVKARPATYFSLAAAFEGLLRHEADAGLLWGPTAGWHMRPAAAPAAALPEGVCAFVPDYTPPAALRWNLHVATRAGDAVLRDRIDGALAALSASGRLAAMSQHYGMPLHQPFADTYSLGALNALQRAR